jgi:hypothetical protein
MKPADNRLAKAMRMAKASRWRSMGAEAPAGGRADVLLRSTMFSFFLEKHGLARAG